MTVPGMEAAKVALQAGGAVDDHLAAGRMVR
jgi:hypothetical protein